MPSSPSSPQPEGPVHGPETEGVYSLEVMARLAGVDTTTVLHYHELGVLSPLPSPRPSSPASSAAPDPGFPPDCLRQLCRLEQLREAHQLTDSGLQFLVSLLDEIEHLRHELRHRTR